MIIAFACDHAGFPFRGDIINHLTELGHEVIDYGPKNLDPLDDFPDYAHIVCESIATSKAQKGVLVCGTGIGMSIAANKFKNIRAVLSYSPEIAKISRSHNDTNVACFGARTMNIGDVLDSLDVFFNTDFLGGKYQARNDKIDSTC
ncbi:ribose 5-phosphate isomerase B [Candidatus Gracilibacteria bacterium]|nr:ribose 5-phosphate isomerase B [Candidatus Gracilibacteria bacterium]